MTATYQTSPQRDGTLAQVEVDALAGLDVVVEQLDLILQAFHAPQAGLAESVASANDRLTDCRLGLHRDVLDLIAETGLTASELRLVAALLNVIPCVARMGEECVALAKVTQHLTRHAGDSDRPYTALDRMGVVTRAQVLRAKRVFAGRDVNLADELLHRDSELKRLGRVVFEWALDGRGVGVPADSGTLALVAAHCLAHIGDDAVEIGEQGYLIVGDAFLEMS